MEFQKKGVLVRGFLALRPSWGNRASEKACGRGFLQARCERPDKNTPDFLSRAAKHSPTAAKITPCGASRRSSASTNMLVPRRA